MSDGSEPSGDDSDPKESAKKDKEVDFFIVLLEFFFLHRFRRAAKEAEARSQATAGRGPEAKSKGISRHARPKDERWAVYRASPEALKTYQDPFARWRQGASRYYQPAKFDPFEEWRRPTSLSAGGQGFQDLPPPFAMEAGNLPGFEPMQALASTCARCGNPISPSNHFCSFCGIPLDRGPGYQHPEKLLPGPPLRHEGPSQVPAALQDIGPGAPSTIPPEPAPSFAGQMLSWFRPANPQPGAAPQPPPPPASTLAPGRPQGQPGPPLQTLAPQRKVCPPPSTLAPNRWVSFDLPP
eukprot:s365_g4.t1